MEPNQAPAELPKSLLDKIAADPDIINRGIVDTGESAVTVTPPPPVTQPEAVAGAEMSAVHMAGAENPAPVLNLLKPGEQTVVEGVEIAGGTSVAAPSRHKWWLVIVGGLIALVVIGGGYLAWIRNAAPKPVAVVTPTPTPTPTLESTPTATPTPTPSPTLAPTPPPETVTAPAVAPTAEHPQAVKVTSKSGLWLRSSPDSSNQKNVISWMPNGATVSVDATGAFWWHGTYAGKTGYFAVNYTQ